MVYNPQRALELLRVGSGIPNARFREGQEDAIRAVVAGTQRLLVVQKTGWGKSFVYFIAVKLLRGAGQGPALLISPLLSLMRNQIAAAARMGVRAETINSDNEEDRPQVVARLLADAFDILLIHPKQLASARFVREVLAGVAPRISLLVIDEAHCISDWGHDFVPEYRLIERISRTLPPNLRVLATTATANNRVLDDLLTVLGPNLAVSRGDLSRPSLALQTIHLPGQGERLAWLAEQLPNLPGSGIVYTLTKRDAVQVTNWLRSRGLNIAAYTSDTGERRPELEQALQDNRVKALVATTALAMGSPASRRCDTPRWCRTSPGGLQRRSDSRFTRSLRRPPSGRHKRPWPTAPSRSTTSTDRWISAKRSSPDLFCSSMTWWTRAGLSPSRPGCCAGTAAARSGRWPWR